jgi:hypothetical protein
VQAANIEVAWSGLGRVKLSLQSEQGFFKNHKPRLFGPGFFALCVRGSDAASASLKAFGGLTRD